VSGRVAGRGCIQPGSDIVVGGEANTLVCVTDTATGPGSPHRPALYLPGRRGGPREDAGTRSASSAATQCPVDDRFGSLFDSDLSGVEAKSIARTAMKRLGDLIVVASEEASVA
jgi:hypothetical protein